LSVPPAGEIVTVKDWRGRTVITGVLTAVEIRHMRDMFGNGNYIRVQFARVISEEGHQWYQAPEILKAI
jgi:hypothetical protein